MVKNSGGNKAKGFARKSFAKTDNQLRISKDPEEVYSQVTKVLGGMMCQVITVDGCEMLCHIRGKFRGRGKRDNFIGIGTWMLVGKREWEKESKGKLLNCDVIEVYNDSDKSKLKNTITTINWSLFIGNDSKMFGNEDKTHDDSGFVFSDEKTQEYQELIDEHVKSTIKNGESSIITTDDGDDIDVDDI